MILDLGAKTVTFKAETTLTLSQLYSLLNLLDDRNVSELDVEAVRPWVIPVNLFEVTSLRYGINSTYCVVHLSDGSWACSCPDWIYRKSVTGESCKHILRLCWLT